MTGAKPESAAFIHLELKVLPAPAQIPPTMCSIHVLLPPATTIHTTGRAPRSWASMCLLKRLGRDSKRMILESKKTTLSTISVAFHQIHANQILMIVLSHARHCGDFKTLWANIDLN